MRPGRAQRGGAAILVAFLLLTLMAAAVFATSRNLTRDLAMGGEALQGTLAACAAEAGLAWFLACADRLRGDWAGPAMDVPPGLLDAAEPGPLRQDVQVRLARLGALPWPGAADLAGQLWLVRATGHCGIRGQGRRGFAQVRELLIQAPPEGASGGLRVLGWRNGQDEP